MINRCHICCKEASILIDTFISKEQGTASFYCCGKRGCAKAIYYTLRGRDDIPKGDNKEPLHGVKIHILKSPLGLEAMTAKFVFGFRAYSLLRHHE